MPMTGGQFLDHLDACGFADSGRSDDYGVSAFCRWLPCTPRTGVRYANNEPIPPAVQKLLRTMKRLGLRPEDVK